MQQLIEVMKLVANKYMNKIDLNLVATLETRKAAYQNAIDTLNNICKPPSTDLTP